MLKVARAAMLLLTLSASVYAGDMQNGLQPNPTPTPDTRTYEGPTEVLVGDAQQSPVTTTEITLALDLVRIVLALF